MDPATAAILAAGVGAAGSIGGGYLSGRSSGKESKTERTKRHLLDQLIGSLSGEGTYSGLYATDYDAFQRSFVDPAKSMFKNQIAPQIQQQYIQSGQQRGTGLDDQLLRAGVDLDQLLNQQYMSFQNQGKDRMQNALNMALGSSNAGTQNMGSGQAFQQAGAGYLASPEFSKMAMNIVNPQQQQQQNQFQPQRKGYLPDWNLGDKRWGQ